MRMNPVYVGELFNINRGAVYINIDEATKEIKKQFNAGIVMVFITLPESPDGRYWIGGVVGPAAKNYTHYNLIFTSDSDLNKHMETLRARGFPLRDLASRELKVNTRGPEVIDIKTEEHYQCEKELAHVKSAIDRGISVSNSAIPMRLELKWHEADTSVGVNEGYSLNYFHDTHAVVHTSSLPLSEIGNPSEILSAFGHYRSFFREIATVDPDLQPVKFSRLKKWARDFLAHPVTFTKEIPQCSEQSFSSEESSSDTSSA